VSQTLANDREFQRWLRRPGSGDYGRVGEWERVGKCALDRKLMALADLYLASTPQRRRLIRNYFKGRTGQLDEMWLYVRRVARLIKGPEDADWLTRGLVVAAIEGGRVDFRDTIVSLVILRYGAQRAGIRHRAYFNRVMKLAEGDARDVLENARDHDREDVAYTVAEMGPPDWAEEVGWE
jgi:hypothetical protein